MSVVYSSATIIYTDESDIMVSHCDAQVWFISQIIMDTPNWENIKSEVKTIGFLLNEYQLKF